MRWARGSSAHRTPGQFGVAQENDFDSLFPPVYADAARPRASLLGPTAAESFPTADYERRDDSPRRQMADLIGRAVPRIGSLARRRAKQAALGESIA